MQCNRDDTLTGIEAASADPNSWIKRGAKALEFHTDGQQKNVTLVPIDSICGKRYSVYWQVS
jgi:hypothetical protein